MQMKGEAYGFTLSVYKDAKQHGWPKWESHMNVDKTSIVVRYVGLREKIEVCFGDVHRPKRALIKVKTLCQESQLIEAMFKNLKVEA